MERKWWHDAVIYQIYPRSFCDSNGDGLGDIPGIISKLDHIKSLGADAVWLSPVYVSPGADNGYDIADYCNIDPMFGTMEDFDRLLAEAKTRDIRIIMDLVINHTSSAHPWFQKSRKRVKGYEDYYIWADKPNNWTGFFGGGTWDYDEVRKQYYLHLFAKEQPDLNWHNPKVMEEVQKILRFWLDKGVAGFRCDVINIIWKNSLANGKKSPLITGLEHYHSTEGCHGVLRRLRSEVLEQYGAFTVGETVFVTPETARDLCEEYRGELDEVFCFEHMETDQVILKWFRTPFDSQKFCKTVSKWQKALTWNANYFENHDQPRSVSRFGDDSPEYHGLSAKMLCTMLLSLRGTPYIFEGQEIGMTNFDFTSMDQIQDVESHNVYGIAKKLGIPASLRWKMMQATSRDNARQPVQWSADEGAGFTSGKPWLGINANHKFINAASQESDPDSILNYYRRMIALRRNCAPLLRGDFQEVETGRHHFVFRRKCSDGAVTVVLNFSDKVIKTDYFGNTLISNYGREFFGGVLQPWEAAVIKE